MRMSSGTSSPEQAHGWPLVGFFHREGTLSGTLFSHLFRRFTAGHCEILRDAGVALEFIARLILQLERLASPSIIRAVVLTTKWKSPVSLDLSELLPPIQVL